MVWGRRALQVPIQTFASLVACCGLQLWASSLFWFLCQRGLDFWGCCVWSSDRPYPRQWPGCHWRTSWVGSWACPATYRTSLHRWWLQSWLGSLEYCLYDGAGFRDIQDLHAERTGNLPVATCRGKTRRDFLFVSRELVPLFQSCQVDDETLSDHSYLIGTFSGAHDCLDRFVWPIPEPMEWTAASCRSPVSLDLFAPGCNLYSDYETFWTEVESHNNRARLQQQKPVVRATTGRGRQRKPQCQDRQIAPTKTSRPGDRQPAFLGTCVQHAQWLKQLRRLQSYVRLARSGISSGAHRAHRFGLWTSILRAPGFAPSFASWWSQRSLALGEPVSVPLVPPDQSLAWILYTLVLNLTSPSSKPLCALLGPMPIGWQKLQMSMPCIALCSVIFPFRWTLWSALPWVSKKSNFTHHSFYVNLGDLQ